ncbi:MAG: minor capsid protein [Anaerovoracaceae bacterium]
MAKSSKEYWAERERENLEKNLKTEAEYYKEIENIYKYTMDQIQKEIDSFYAKYASKEGITIAEAKKRVSKLDVEEFSRKAKKYVEEKNFSKQANEEMRLYNLTMKVNRLELLKAQIGLELVAGFDELQQFFEEKLNERTMEEFQRQAGILGYTILDNEKMAEAIVNASFKNATFSERIWTHQELLRAELEKLLRTGLLQGRNPRELARQLRKVFNASVFNSERLLRTELARVQTEAQRRSFIRNGFDEYMYITSNDFKVCAICKPLNGRHFKVENMTIGDNAPPMHPLCRCSTAAYMNDEDYDNWLSGYKDHGLSFSDWKKKNLLKNEKGALNEYISSGGYKINEKLRKKMKLGADDKEFISNLDSALSKMPTYSGNLLRTLYIPSSKERERFLKKYEAGKNVTYDEYISTSKKKEYNDNANIMIYIQNSKKGADISKFNPLEEEVLYNRGATFKVKHITNIDDVIYILMEEAN